MAEDIGGCGECGIDKDIWEEVFHVYENKPAFKALLFRLRDASKPVDAGDRNLLIRLLEPMVKE